MNSPSELSRRSVLRMAATAGTVGTIGLAGCFFPPPDVTSPTVAGGTTPGGAIPTIQTVYREDADVEVGTADSLEAELDAREGDIVWVPNDVTIAAEERDISTGNNTVASGRTEGESGGLIVTDDRKGGSAPPGTFEVESGGRLTGLEIRGPHHNYTDSDVIPGYIPMAPGSTYDIRQQWRNDWYAVAVRVRGENVQIDNCEIWGWSTGIRVGDGSLAVDPAILHCAIHNCMMTSAGYPVDVRRGMATIYRCWFDAYRHALNGSGLADAGYEAIECTFGPHTSSHVLDMHRVGNNQSGSSNPDDLRYRQRAGRTMLVRESQIMPTNIVDQDLHNGVDAGPHEPSPYVNHRPGGQTPHVHVRGIPDDGFYFENNACAHPNPDTGINQSGTDGYSTDANGWYNVYASDNQWGVDFSGEDDAGGLDNTNAQSSVSSFAATIS